MNEQLKGFLKKASEDGPLKEELGALAGLPEEERAERAAAIAREAGFDVSVEDFAPVETELDDDELNVVAGGSYACCCRQTGTGLMDDRPVLCDCPREGTGAWTDGSGVVNVATRWATLARPSPCGLAGRWRKEGARTSR